jgi:hypothetical protein
MPTMVLQYKGENVAQVKLSKLFSLFPLFTPCYEIYPLVKKTLNFVFSVFQLTQITLSMRSRQQKRLAGMGAWAMINHMQNILIWEIPLKVFYHKKNVCKSMAKQ